MKNKKGYNINNVNGYADTMLEKINTCIKDELKKQTRLDSAVVKTVNSNGSVDIYFPPKENDLFTNISNQTPFELFPGDSVDVMVKNGVYSNCWIVAKHGVSNKIENKKDIVLDKGSEQSGGGDTAGCVRYNIVQQLTEKEKENAQKNIGVYNALGPNRIEKIKVADTIMPITNKTVTIPKSTNSSYGVVKVSDTIENNLETVASSSSVYKLDQKITNKQDKKTTLAGYGITDAKIEKNAIILGNQAIVPLTEHQDISSKIDKIEVPKQNEVPILLDNSGIKLKSSGFTIKASVPENAIFTDTVYEHPSYNAEGTYTKVQVDNQGHITSGENPTTLAGYGIIDAKIEKGIITLGDQTLAPLTEEDIKNAVFSPSTSTNGNIAIFNSETGKEIKDSGFTIKTSVPENAIFTDTVYEHPSYNTEGTYTKVQVDNQGHITSGENPATLAGYGITDAKIEKGVITLGDQTLTPLIEHQDISNKVNKVIKPKENEIPILVDNTGVNLKGSGFTIKTSVPPNAVFTDTVYEHPNSGVIAGEYIGLTINQQGHITSAKRLDTLKKYGIIDAKIEEGIITLGDQTLAPLTGEDIKNTVFNPSTSVKGNIAIFNSETGKEIKDSGFTIDNIYTLPVAGLNKLGGVTTTSSVQDTSNYLPCPIIEGVPYYSKESMETHGNVKYNTNQNLREEEKKQARDNISAISSDSPTLTGTPKTTMISAESYQDSNKDQIANCGFVVEMAKKVLKENIVVEDLPSGDGILKIIL